MSSHREIIQVLNECYGMKPKRRRREKKMDKEDFRLCFEAGYFDGKTFEEIMNKITTNDWNDRIGPVEVSRMYTRVCTAIKELASDFKTEMENRGAIESYYESEAAIEKILRGEGE